MKMLLQKVVLVSEYAVTEKIDFFYNRTDGHHAVTVGRVGLTECSNREYIFL